MKKFAHSEPGSPITLTASGLSSPDHRLLYRLAQRHQLQPRMQTVGLVEIPSFATVLTSRETEITFTFGANILLFQVQRFNREINGFGLLTCLSAPPEPTIPFTPANTDSSPLARFRRNHPRANIVLDPETLRGRS